MPPLKPFKKSCLTIAIGQIVSAPIAQSAEIALGSMCNLNQAILSANMDSAFDGVYCQASFTPGGHDTIVLTPSSVLTLSTGFANSSNNTFTGTPFVSSAITIEGGGATIQRQSNAPFRLLAVTGSGNLTLNDLTLSGGSLTNQGSGGAVYVAANAKLTMSNVTVSGNTVSANNGGGLYARGGQIDIRNSVVTQNQALKGGGIDLDPYASLSVQNSEIRSNLAFEGGGGISLAPNATANLINADITTNTGLMRGGGIYAETGSSLSLRRSSVFANRTRDTFAVNPGNTIAASLGGGIFSDGAKMTIADTRLQANYATSQGGGIFQINGESTISDCYFYENNAIGGEGGAIAARSADIDIKRSTFIRNGAGANAGAISVAFNGGTVGVYNSTFSFNDAKVGSVFSSRFNGELRVTNSTLSFNSQTENGAVYLRAASILIRNSIVAGNTSTVSGAQPAHELYASTSNPSITPLNSLVLQNNVLGHAANTSADSFAGATIGNSNITATSNGNSPTALSSIVSQSLSYNGGATPTHALVANSPAIDAGNQNVCNISALAKKDQRGFFHLGICDIGAFEFGGLESLPFDPASTVPSLNLLLFDEDE